MGTSQLPVDSATTMVRMIPAWNEFQDLIQTSTRVRVRELKSAYGKTGLTPIRTTCARWSERNAVPPDGIATGSANRRSVPVTG